VLVAILVPDANEVETPFSKTSWPDTMFVRLRKSPELAELILGLVLLFKYTLIRKHKYKYGISAELRKM